MAFTARLSEGLEREAKLYAESLGISLNALLAVSLRDYLDRRPSAPQALEAAVAPLEGQAAPLPPLAPSAPSSAPLVSSMSPSAPPKPSAPVISSSKWRKGSRKGRK